ncbi:MAG TPA: zinc-binding dehydrogenase [Chloroflexota bacterium]|nr:zinc-binding dehydrogenase [Chloroflexota bacterium]
MLALVSTGATPDRVELREAPDPSPGRGEAVVRVEAVSLNRGEINRLASAPGEILGWDLAGTVAVPAADGQGMPEGTRVVGFARSGGWAQYAAAPNLTIAEIPDDVSFGAAATLPVAGLTALRLLRDCGPILGKRVLITGASGGVGRFAVQLAALGGAAVTAVAGSAGRAQGLEEIGAREVVTSLDGLEPFDVILESVGGQSLAQALQLVVLGGVIMTFGNSSRQSMTVDPSVFYGRNGARLQGFSLLAPNQPQNFSEDLRYLASLVGTGKLDPQIGREESWRNANAAIEALMNRQVNGKVVLTID